MANVLDPSQLGQDNANQLDQNNLDQTQQNVSQSQGQTGSGSNTSTSSNNSTSPNQQRGSGFVNLQQYSKANQGNQLGQTVSNNIQQVGDQAQQNLQKAQNQFNQQSQANQFNTTSNQKLVQDVLTNPAQYANSPNQQQASQFQTLLSGQYQGPQGLQNANQIQSQAQNVNQMAQALGSSAGRVGLLQQLNRNPQYNIGEANLDSMLLGQSNNPALQQARQRALGLSGQVNNAIQGAQAQAQQNINEAQQFGQNAQNQFNTDISSQYGQLQTLATQLQNQRNRQYQQTLKDLSNPNNLTQDEANLLGLKAGETTYNLLSDPTKYISENADQAHANTVANAQQYAQMQALQKLGGLYANQANQSALAQFANPAEANSFQNEQAINSNSSKFASDLQNAQNNINSQLQSPYQGYQQAQQIDNLVNQRDSVNQQIAQLQQQIGPMDMSGPTTPQGKAIQQQINQLQQQAQDYQNQIGQISPLAVTNGTTRTNWASGNLTTAQNAYQQALQSVQQLYGSNPGTVELQGQQYVAPTSMFPGLFSAMKSPGPQKIPGQS